METLEKTLAAAADLRKKVPMLSVYESIRVVQEQFHIDAHTDIMNMGKEEEKSDSGPSADLEKIG